MDKRPLKHRDINWLYFNERVLLEAANPTTPLLERLKFLAIFSSNLDEYFKVRVSQLRQLKAVDKPLRKKLVLKPNKKLKFILKTVRQQQERYGAVFGGILEELRDEGIRILQMEELDTEQNEYVSALFETEIRPHCSVIDLVRETDVDDSQLYLIADISDTDFDTIKIPVKTCGRFIELPGPGLNLLFLDDIVRAHAPTLLPQKQVKGAFGIKMSRDAELYLEDDYTDAELVDRIYNALGKRESGQPTRLLFDADMPESLQRHLQSELGLGSVDMLEGGRYHNLSDLFGFPVKAAHSHLQYGPMPPLLHPEAGYEGNLLDRIGEKDLLVHFPYQEFDLVETFIENAAQDPSVTSIKLSLYRIAKSSKLTDAVLKALELGKQVLLFVEAQARFDEENNIKWGRIFQEKGATVLFSVPNIKVHSKIALVERVQEGRTQRYAYIGTGNFNAKTAKLYCDHGLLTAHEGITGELAQVFDVLDRKLIIPKLKYLLVSPFTSRNRFMELIQNEIDNARQGKPAGITAKMNSLEDSKMIQALYRASEAGVPIRLLVRGFCCLQPKALSELAPGEAPIVITSIIDRYLEHGRIYLFENGGSPKMFIGSADWMTRNLDKRIEVLTPILDTAVFSELKDILELQLQDTAKARVIDAEDSNHKVEKAADTAELRSQYAIYAYLKAKTDAAR